MKQENQEIVRLVVILKSRKTVKVHGFGEA
jgi:hypothetical protein